MVGFGKSLEYLANAAQTSPRVAALNGRKRIRPPIYSSEDVHDSHQTSVGDTSVINNLIHQHQSGTNRTTVNTNEYNFQQEEEERKYTNSPRRAPFDRLSQRKKRKEPLN